MSGSLYDSGIAWMTDDKVLSVGGGLASGWRGMVPSNLTELMLRKLTEAGVDSAGLEFRVPRKWKVGWLLCLPCRIVGT